MKRTLLLATSLLAIWVPTAFADSPFLKGTYAFTGNDTCLVSLGGFDSLFQPTVGSIVFSNSLIAKGTINFDGNGHGTVQGTTMVILAPPLPVFITPSASTDSFNYSITYTVNDDNSVTDSMVPGSYSGSILNGNLAGVTFVLDLPSFVGQISEDGSAIVSANLIPTVETFKTSNNLIQPRICQRSRVLIKLKQDNDHR
jgi:hypothetical protein